MSSTIQVGVIGAGANTRLHHIPKLKAIWGVEVVAVCNRSRASGDAVADEFGIPQVYTSWTELIDDPAIDAVVIGTWPATHCVMTCAALEAGKHVLTEARMAMNAAEAHQMWETSKQCPDQVAQVVPAPFTLAFDRTMQRVLAEGLIGEVLAVDVHGAPGSLVDPAAPLSWRMDRSLSGFNTLTLGIWYEALARWVGHAKRVVAMSKTVVRQRRDEVGTLHAVEVPEHVDVVAELYGGPQLHLRCSAVTGFCPTPGSAFLYGTEGTLMLDATGGVLRARCRGEDAFQDVPVAEQDRGGWRVEEEFIGAIRGTEPVRLTPFAEGVRYMEFTEAVAISAAEGRAVSLPLLE